MAVTLGKDAVITVAGQTITSARAVSASWSVSEIDCTPYGDSVLSRSFAGPASTEVEVECLDGNEASAFDTAVSSGEIVNISTAGASGDFIVTKYTINEPLDGPVTYTATLKRTRT